MWMISIGLIGCISYMVAFISPGIISTLTLAYTLFSASIVPGVLLIPWRRKLGIGSTSVMISFLSGAIGVLVLKTLESFGVWEGSLLFIPLFLGFIGLLILPAVSRIKNSFEDRKTAEKLSTSR